MNGRKLRAAAALALTATLAGCIPSNVVSRDLRMVAADLETLLFEPVHDLVLDGLFTSVAITGDAALSLRKVYYLFTPNGNYTAAALVEDQGTAAFQTLSGTWQMTAEGLVLDGAAAVPVERAPDHLRLLAQTGTLVLRRETQL